MLSKEYILKESEIYEIKRIMAVYFLINENEIIYVGSGINLHNRIRTHVANKKIKFTRLYFIVMDNYEDMLFFEKKYIEKLTPIYNLRDNPEAEKEKLIAISIRGTHKDMQWREVEEIFKNNNLKLRHKSIT